VLVDFPADIFSQCDIHGVDLTAVSTVIISHGHADHLHTYSFRWRHGCDDPDPQILPCPPSRLGYVPDLHIHASRENIDAIKATLRFGSEKDYRLIFHALEPGKRFEAHGLSVTPLPSSHGMVNDTPFNFLFESDDTSLLYLVDSDLLLAETWELLKDARLDVIVAECTAWDKDESYAAGHMNMDKVRVTWQQAEQSGMIKDHGRLVLTHLSHLSPPHDLITPDTLPNPMTIVAHDGLEIRV
jgi:ribonuclease BN (tRNA processing enzyme)